METIIGAIFTGVTAVLIAISGLYAQSGRKRAFDRKAANAENKRLETQFLAARRWGIRNEQQMLDEKLLPAPRPEELDLDWGLAEEDDGEPPPRRKAVKA